MMRIAVAQVDPTVGAIADNAAQISAAINTAATAGVQLVVVPLQGLSGDPLADLASDDALLPRLREAAQEISAAVPAGLTAVIASRAVGQRAAHTAGPGSFAFVLRTNAVQEVPLSHVIDVAGAQVHLVEADGAQADGALPPAQLHVAFGAGRFGDPAFAGSAFAQQVGSPVCYANLAGAQDGLVFAGGSAIFGPDGAVAAEAAPFRADLLVWDPAAEPAGTWKPAPADGPLWLPLAARDTESGRLSAIYLALMTALRSYVQKNGFESVALGLSGGIDSALVAVLAADALGGSQVHGVMMPSAYSSEHSLQDAQDSAARVGMQLHKVEIAPLVSAFQSSLPLEGVAAENLQARIRGVLLMGLSNSGGHLVLATGNKSELAVGYSTIYGDAVGGFAPIADVFKTDVWALSRWRNNVALDAGMLPPIPESSITKPPSAELSPGQTDQDTLPAYPLLDSLLAQYLYSGANSEELITSGFDRDVVLHVMKLVKQAEWKRRQYPVAARVSPVAFGHDRQVPITTHWAN